MSSKRYPEQRLLAARKLHPKFTPVVFAFYMSSIMAFLMTIVITAVNAGMAEGFMSLVWQAYQIAMPVAFVCILIVRPVVARLVQWTVRSV
ncbi:MULTISPECIES: DUF2798 domain-containing protein [unclassified Halomonas]|uniref:DUF2798 domain-containing protein n=1 Tax=unclassified Halomonas TaxID=2609666 RepID=UPI0021E4066F|nr:MULTISPECIES: DUF2798 domain-containing protein [unclassified Halomonas]UYF99641.1 DUF2798 domain-containing protein [Halomonas sp. GD1P12]WNL39268.1 DUF2798 domain-containing protein [Halomonas sp. PAMB 3232]WNL42609.1 DUF2798 domain-containing protein [Halomonas sp. PAMB 3264]